MNVRNGCHAVSHSRGRHARLTAWPTCAPVRKRELPVRTTDGEIVVTVPSVEGHEVLATGSERAPTGERNGSPTGGPQRASAYPT
ncbi:hypothetical protein GCM10010464_27150 [Pseudonocardia yunnanensis]